MAIPNRFNSRCSNPNCPEKKNRYGALTAGYGFAVKQNGRWMAYCPTCCPEKIEPSKSQERRLTKEGQVIMPYEAANMPLLRAFPGYKNVKQPDGSWVCTISTHMGDRERVLELANKLQLEVAPELKTVLITEEAGFAETKGLYPFQIKGVNFLSIGNHRLLGDEMGCIDGEAIVHVNRGRGTGGKSFKIKLMDLHHRFNGGKVSGNQYWDQTIPTRIRSLCNGELRLNNIVSVLDKGVKSVVKLTLASGKTLRLTPDHEICGVGLNGEEEWVEVQKVSPGEKIYVNGTAVCSECKGTKNLITYPGSKFLGYCKKCMYRIKRGKPNFKGGKYVDKDGYIVIRAGEVRDHPRFTPWGIGEHILVMEKKLGRYLLPDEVVHHKDENKQNNSPNNLELKTGSSHAFHHSKKDGYKHLDGGISAKGGLVVFIPKQDEVVSVVPDGETHVYDIVCENPHRNFVANGIVVHNCGKTPQSLCALPKEARGLVVCPNGLKYTWRNECLKWRPDLKPVVLNAGGSFRLPNNGELVIMNYDILPDWLTRAPKVLLGSGRSARWANLPEAANGENLLEEGGDTYLVSKDYWCSTCDGNGCEGCKNKGLNPKPSDVEISKETFEFLAGGSFMRVILIGDEGHKAKNYKSLRSKRIKTLSRLVWKSWCLTGTPLLTRASDLWGTLDSFNMANLAFGTFSNFCRLFNAQKGRWGGIEWGMPSPEVPERLRRVMLRRTRAEVLPDLPKKTITQMVVNGLSDSVRKRLDELEEEWGDYIETSEELPPFEEFSRIRAEIAAGRVEATLDYVEECEEQDIPLIVASAHRAPIDALDRRPGWATITGDTPSARRAAIVEEFQSGRLRGVGLTIQAGGVGITLTRAWKMLFVDLDWTPANNAQCEDRICRIGQESSKVEIVRMVSDHVLDQHILNLIAKKIALIEASIEKTVTAKITPNFDKVVGETEEQYQARLVASAVSTFNNMTSANNIEVSPEKRAELTALVQKEQARAKVAQMSAKYKSKIGKWLEQPITEELKDSIHKAYTAMCNNDPDYALELNGIGWNKPDSYLARWVGHNLGTDEECRAMWGLLYKYKRQLQHSFPCLWPK